VLALKKLKTTIENLTEKIMEQALLDQALAMSPNERVEFAQLILASIEHEDEKIRGKWIAEVKDRMEAVKSGKSKLIDFDSLYHED
jgi:putative addiction module component (TIGR02574 family)